MQLVALNFNNTYQLGFGFTGQSPASFDIQRRHLMLGIARVSVKRGGGKHQLVLLIGVDFFGEPIVCRCNAADRQWNITESDYDCAGNAGLAETWPFWLREFARGFD